MSDDIVRRIAWGALNASRIENVAIYPTSRLRKDTTRPQTAKEVEMFKMALGTGRAVALVLMGLLAWGAQANAHVGILGTQLGANDLFVQEAACDAADPLCDQGKELTCVPGSEPNHPDCSCSSCEGFTVCPDTHNCAPYGQCRPCGAIWTCCIHCTRLNDGSYKCGL